MVPLKSKSGKDVSSDFRSILEDPDTWNLLRDAPSGFEPTKGNFSKFQNLLKCEGIQFQVCLNPDIKCSNVERVQRIVRDKLYKYFTHKNTHRYVDVLSDFVTGNNATVHGSTCVAPANVTDFDILALCKRMQKKTGQGVC